MQKIHETWVSETLRYFNSQSYHNRIKQNLFMNYEETETEIIRTDTETKQESVKTKWRKIGLRAKALTLFSRNYQILIEEV